MCRAPTRSLTIVEPLRGGPITIACANGCDPDLVRATLHAEPAQVRIEALRMQLAQALGTAESAARLARRALELLEAQTAGADHSRDGVAA
jgi:hypothetical protein